MKLDLREGLCWWNRFSVLGVEVYDKKDPILERRRENRK